jgi:hypothetical protein
MSNEDTLTAVSFDGKMTSLSSPSWNLGALCTFIAMFLFRYVRLIVHIGAWLLSRPVVGKDCESQAVFLPADVTVSFQPSTHTEETS